MKSLIDLEIQRFPGVLFLANAIIFTFILYLTFAQDTFQPFSYFGASYFFMVLYMVIGLPFGTIFLLSFSKDINNGVFLSYLSLPYSPLQVISQKYIAYFVLFLLSLYIPFFAVMPILVTVSISTYLEIGLLVLYSSLILTAVVFVGMCLRGEISVIFYSFYLFFITFFMEFLPEKYQNVVNPINYFSKQISGMHTYSSATSAYLSILLYLGMFVVSLIILHKRQWGRIL